MEVYTALAWKQMEPIPKTEGNNFTSFNPCLYLMLFLLQYKVRICSRCTLFKISEDLVRSASAFITLWFSKSSLTEIMMESSVEI